MNTEDLEIYIKKCIEAYYKGEPLISDEVYDRLVENTQFENEVGNQQVNPDEQRFNHPFPMYSLQKVFVGEDKEPNWDKTQPYIMTAKLDGAAVSVTYVNGELYQALTRGDGKQGLDITEKIRYLVPEVLSGTLQGAVSKELIQITGEVVCPKTIANARNFASGSLGLKDNNEFGNRVREHGFQFVAYGLQPNQEDRWNQDMALLDMSGFKTVIQSDWSMFPNEGSVIRLDSNTYFESLGYTSHHPRGAYALKIRQKGVVTKLLDVEWQVGKSGAVSPVAILEPCIIGEATVSRATLHNKGYIEALGLEIGCMVEVIRSGEIIPRIVGRIDE